MNAQSIILAGLISLLFPASIALAQGPSLSPQFLQSVEQWRSTQLPATDLETYWTTLKALGERIDETTAERIRAAGSSDLPSAIAHMAYHVAREPNLAKELGAMYGVRHTEIDINDFYAIRDRLLASGMTLHEAMAAIFVASPRTRAAPGPLPIIPLHREPEFLPFWQAWLLAPPVEPTTRHMRRNIERALSELGDDRTIALLVEKCRLLEGQITDADQPERQEEARRQTAFAMMGIIRAIGGESVVPALLECLHHAEQGGYAGEGLLGLRSSVRRMISSRSRMEEELRDPDSDYVSTLRELGKPIDDPEQFGPTDDRWREFKPVVERLLREPGALAPGHAALLREALKEMP